MIANILTDFPVPCGKTTVPLICWLACLGSTPSLNATSTVSLNLAVFVFKTNFRLLQSVLYQFNYCLTINLEFLVQKG